MGNNYDRCKICGRLGWMATQDIFPAHICPPKWYVFHEDYHDGCGEDEFEFFFATDAQEAQRKALNQAGDFNFHDGSTGDPIYDIDACRSLDVN